MEQEFVFRVLSYRTKMGIRTEKSLWVVGLAALQQKRHHKM
jgi:hypothetical protein